MNNVMKPSFVIVSICALLVQNSHQKSTAEDSEYVAAIVEYHPSAETNVNLDAYITFIQDASEKNADIIVFPEATLNYFQPCPVPVQPGTVTAVPPCFDTSKYDPLLVRISCAAIANQIYVVINVAEQLNCTKPQPELCPQRKAYRFNTNVVFDREGHIIDKYRKIHLFIEPESVPSFDKHLGVFDTDFGVRFGHIICFDILFQTPPVLLVQEKGIRNIIMTTMWYSQMPMFVATQVQEGFAYAHNVNLIAANANNVKEGSTGSGIYSGKEGTLSSLISLKTLSHLLVFPVPKIPGKPSKKPTAQILFGDESEDNLTMISYPDMKDYVTIHVPEDESRVQVIKITHGNIFCQFHIRLQKSAGTINYKYRIFARDADVEHAGEIMGIAECGLMACLNDTLESCGHRLDYGIKDATHKFLNLTIEAELPSPSNDKEMADNVVVYPFTLSTNLHALPSETLQFSRTPVPGKSNIQRMTLSLEKPSAEILTFGLWGRIFHRDIYHANPF